jgi:hypothetical protein
MELLFGKLKMLLVDGAVLSLVRRTPVAFVDWRRKTPTPFCASPSAAKRPEAQAPLP